MLLGWIIKIRIIVFALTSWYFEISYSAADKCQLLSLKAQTLLNAFKTHKTSNVSISCILKEPGSICFSQKTHHVNIDWKIIFIVNEQTHWFMCTWSIGCDKIKLLNAEVKMKEQLSIQYFASCNWNLRYHDQIQNKKLFVFQGRVWQTFENFLKKGIPIIQLVIDGNFLR